MEYRVAEMRDLDALVELRCRFLSEASGRPVDSHITDAIRRTFGSHMEQNRIASWLALSGDRVVGTGSITFWERLPNASSPNGLCGYIANKYTVPEHRGQRIASIIFKHLLDEARERGVPSLSLHTLSAGAGIYTKAGFAFSDNVMSMQLR